MKVQPEQVREMRQLFASGAMSQDQLAVLYRCAQSTVQKVVRGLPPYDGGDGPIRRTDEKV